MQTANDYGTNENSEIIELLKGMQNLTVVLNDGTVVGKLGPMFNQYFGNEANLNGRLGR